MKQGLFQQTKFLNLPFVRIHLSITIISLAKPLGDIVSTLTSTIVNIHLRVNTGYMGPASSWAFCRRVLALVGKHLPEANNEPPPWHLDGVAFRLQWRPLMPEEHPDISNLPPSDYAFFLVQTARFYLGPLASLIDETEFLQHFKELYQDASTKASTCKLWYAQYLLMIAFGKAFLGGKSADGSPPGHQYAARAMPLMPELAGIALDPILSAQALTLAAIYFQSIDMRVAAYQHVSKIIFIARLADTDKLALR